jgi:hypothetical protein
VSASLHHGHGKVTLLSFPAADVRALAYDLLRVVSLIEGAA